MRLLTTTLCFLSICFAGIASAQEATAKEKLVLADGTELFVNVDKDGITEEGLSVKWQGAQMQIEWKMTDASAMKGLRLSIVNWQSAEDIRTYGAWCSNNGLFKEFELVAERHLTLTGKTITRASISVLKEDTASEPEGEPEATDPEGEPGVKPDKEPAKPEPKKETRKTGGAYLPVYIDAPKAKGVSDKQEELLKVSLKESLEGSLKESGLTILSKKSKEGGSLVFNEARFELGKNPKFYGSSAYMEYKGVAKIEILDADGKRIATREFDTGFIRVYPKEIAHLRALKKGMRSLEEDEKLYSDYVKGRVRETLISSVAAWARGYLPRASNGG